MAANVALRVARRLAAEQRRDLAAERREPPLEAREMLLGEQLRRCHDGRLASGRGRDQRRHGGHHGFPGAHVALQQPVHRRARAEIGADLVEGGLLRARQRERQRGAKRLEPRGCSGERPGALGARARSQAPQAQPLRNELFERDAARARMHAGEQQGRRCIARRRVQIAQGFGEGRPRLTRERPRRELGCEVVVESLAVEHDERALDQPAHRLLVQPFGSRIDRGQTIARLGVIGAHGAMLGVDHLEPGRPRPHLSVAAHAPATLERLLLRAIEVEEPQRDGAGAVGEPA